MNLVPFDEFKKSSLLEPEECENCDSYGTVDCDCCGHTSDCSFCDEGLLEPDYAGEYINNLIDTMRKAGKSMTLSCGKSIIMAIRSDGNIARRYDEIRRLAHQLRVRP